MQAVKRALTVLGMALIIIGLTEFLGYLYMPHADQSLVIGAASVILIVSGLLLARMYLLANLLSMIIAGIVLWRMPNLPWYLLLPFAFAILFPIGYFLDRYSISAGLNADEV